MKISEAGLKLIKSFEGCRLTAYKCVPTEKYYTIGYGHYGSDVKEGMTITQEQADDFLKKDIEKFEKKVNKYSGYNFNQNEFDALVSFCYNIGNIDGITKKGTRTIEEISSSFMLYTKSGGKELKGLVRRRTAERELFDKTINGFYPSVSKAFGSLVDALKYIGVDASYTNRKKIAIANGISNYSGFGSQNLYLLSLLKEGKLKRV